MSGLARPVAQTDRWLGASTGVAARSLAVRPSHKLLQLQKVVVWRVARRGRGMTMAAKKKRKRSTAPPPQVRRRSPRAATGPTRREQAKEAQRVQDQRDGRRRRLATAALVTAVLAAVSLYIFLDRRESAELRAFLTAGSCTVDTKGDPTAGPGANHVTNPSFQVNPPAGGNHLASAARGGVFAAAAAPADGLLVHSLEHGYIVVWHAPGLASEQMSRLAEFQASHDGDVIVVERAGMRAPVAATAWNQRLLCGQVEPAPLGRFFDKYVGQGPEDVPRG